MSFSEGFLRESAQVVSQLDAAAIERCVDLVAELRERGGRLFILGVGGSAANASHAVNDFRKLANIEAYAPSDNVSEITARTNDDGWSMVFEAWLRTSRLSPTDLVFVLSVGGGSRERNISPNIVAALDYARAVGARIIGIVGRDGGHTARLADGYVLVPTVNEQHVTQHAESAQAVVWHLMVSHPRLKVAATKWESLEYTAGANS